jgi:hypothetical protein
VPAWSLQATTVICQILQWRVLGMKPNDRLTMSMRGVLVHWHGDLPGRHLMIEADVHSEVRRTSTREPLARHCGITAPSSRPL